MNHNERLQTLNATLHEMGEYFGSYASKHGETDEALMFGHLAASVAVMGDVVAALVAEDKRK